MRFIIFIFLLMLVVSSSSQNDTNTAIQLNNLSSTFEKNNQSDSATALANRALLLSIKLKYKLGLSEAYNNLGNINRHKANYPNALNYYYKGLVIDEVAGNNEGALLKLGNIGIIYFNQNDNNKALEYYNRARVLAEKLNDKKAIANVLANTADVYCNQGKIQVALKYYDSAYENYKSVNSAKGMSNVLINSGNAYIDNGNAKLALEKYTLALKIVEELKDKKKIASCLLDIAFANSQLKNNAIAEIYFNKALSYTKDVDDLDWKSSLELAVSEFYYEGHAFEKALCHFKNHIALKDSVYNEENTKQSVKAEMNYEFEKKQTAIKFTHDKIVYQLEADNKLQKQWRVFFVLVILFAFILLFFVKRAYDNKKKLATHLYTEDQRKELLLREVHHRINNNLQIISSLLTLQANNAANEKLTEYLTQSQNRIQSLAALHELLYDTNSPLEINMQDYLNKVLDFHRDVLNTLNNKVTLETTIESVRFPTKIAVPLALIINELVTNSIKYAFKDTSEGLIKIVLSKNDVEHNWALTISDNGRGMPTESERRKDSLGLKLVTIMAKQIKATLTSENDTGSVFKLIFKVPK